MHAVYVLKNKGHSSEEQSSRAKKSIYNLI